MFRRSLLGVIAASLLPLAAVPQPGRPASSRGKIVWNYDGGIPMLTEGEIPEGPCFRLNGHVTSGDFFESLRREDTTSGTLYRRGNDLVTEFPGTLRLTLVLQDQTCSEQLLQPASTRGYLTEALIHSMRLNFAWKRGVELRPAKDVKLQKSEAAVVPPFAAALAAELPKKYQWRFDFDVPSRGVPLTDSLVLVIYSPGGHIIARVAARL